MWLALGTAVAGVLLGFYITVYLQAQPPTVRYQATAAVVVQAPSKARLAHAKGRLQL